MKIQEVSTRTGLTAPNIRFYERQGLLNPQRQENGYREYSEEDVQDLLRIRLLRELDISLEDILRLQRDELSLSAALALRQQRLQQESRELVLTGLICRQLRESGTEYGALEPEPFLQQLSSSSEAALPSSAPLPELLPVAQAKEIVEGTEESVSSPPPASAVQSEAALQPELIKEPEVCITRKLQQDIPAFEYHPWRRYFARFCDLTLYTLIPSFVWFVVLHHSPQPSNSQLLFNAINLAAVAVCLILEPLLLSRFGTTPGKWAFGIRVRSDRGGNLDLADAFSRTAVVLWSGIGLNISFFSAVQLFRSWRRHGKEEEQPWEDASHLEYADWNVPMRGRLSAIAAGAAVVILPVLLNFLFILNAYTMPHKGSLTVAEFAQNYNYAMELIFPDQRFNRLDETAAWEPWVESYHQDGSGVFHYYGSEPDRPVFTPVVGADGRLQGLTMEMDTIDDQFLVILHGNGYEVGVDYFYLGALAAAGGQFSPLPFPLNSKLSRFLDSITTDPISDHSLQLGSIQLEYRFTATVNGGLDGIEHLYAFDQFLMVDESFGLHPGYHATLTVTGLN